MSLEHTVRAAVQLGGDHIAISTYLLRNASKWKAKEAKVTGTCAQECAPNHPSHQPSPRSGEADAAHQAWRHGQPHARCWLLSVPNWPECGKPAAGLIGGNVNSKGRRTSRTVSAWELRQNISVRYLFRLRHKASVPDRHYGMMADRFRCCWGARYFV